MSRGFRYITAYSEVVPRETTEMFIRARENAFFAFGWVPRVLVIDNLLARTGFEFP